MDVFLVGGLLEVLLEKILGLLGLGGYVLILVHENISL
jgi:hypothetical protein